MNTTAAHTAPTKPRSRFGRSKFGGSPAALIAGSIVAGLAAACAAALILWAIVRPEESIESSWYDNATQNTFHIILFAIGALGVASVFTDVKLSLGAFAISSYV